MASDAVLKYLVDTNRPYSCTDVTVNLRGAFPKSAIQKALDALSESGKIKCKLYGKQKVYAAIQLDTDDGNDDIVDYDAQMKSLTVSFEEKNTLLKSAETSLKILTSAPTTESAQKQIDETCIRTESLKLKLETLQNSKEVISAEEKSEILSSHEKLLREYR